MGALDRGRPARPPPFGRRVALVARDPGEGAPGRGSAGRRGLKAIIVGAGGASHLAGIIAAETILPVIGVPIDSSPLSGIDSLLSTVQMPSGVPVATMAVGKAGAVNAAIFAAEIIATSDKAVAQRLALFKRELEKSVVAKSEKVKKEFKV